MNVQKNEMVVYETESGAQVALSPQIIRQYLVNGQGNVTDQEVTMFLQLCKYQGLNPFLREAYLIKYGDRNPATIVVGKEVFTKRASRHPEYAGMEAGIYVLAKGGEVTERKGTITLPGETVVGGWARVYRKGYQVPFEYTCSYDEYAQRRADGSVNQQWSTKPATMIRKCAVVAALREAFPVEFGAMYSQEEINTVDSSELPAAPILTTVNDFPSEAPTVPPTASEEYPPLTVVLPEPPPSAPAKPATTKGTPVSQPQMNLIMKLITEKKVPEQDYRFMIAPKSHTKDLTSQEASKVITQLKDYIFTPDIDEDELPF